MFEQDCFSEKILITYYRGISVQKGVCFYFFALYSKTALRIFIIFCISVEDCRAHSLNKIVFLKKIIIPDYRGSSVQKGVFLLFWHLLQNGSKDLPNFLHECRGEYGPFFEQDCFSEKNLNPGLSGIKSIGPAKRIDFVHFDIYFSTIFLFSKMESYVCQL